MDLHLVVQNAIPLLTSFALKVVGALVLWTIGRRLIQFGTGLLVRSLKYPFDQTVAAYIGTTVKVLLNIVLIVAILGFFGIETTSFAALMAGVGLAIGAAWSGLLSNLAAGIFILIYGRSRSATSSQFTPLGPVLAVRPYCDNQHYWQVYFDTNRVIREAFGEAGFPAPEQNVFVRTLV
jgi:small-conductance mechanosensitive channel